MILGNTFNQKMDIENENEFSDEEKQEEENLSRSIEESMPNLMAMNLKNPIEVCYYKKILFKI